jgi:hypothetical protein
MIRLGDTRRDAGEHWLIYGPTEDPDAPYWSNTDGWTTRAGATRFTTAERGRARLPMGGVWRRDDVPEAGRRLRGRA